MDKSQSRALPSKWPVRSRLPSGLKATPRAPLGCSRGLRISLTIGVPEPGHSRSSVRHPGLGDEGLAIRAEGHRQDQVLVLQAVGRGDGPWRPTEAVPILLGSRRPLSALPVGAQGCCPDPASELSLPSHRAGGDVPQPRRAVGASGQARFAIGTEGHAEGIATESRGSGSPMRLPMRSPLAASQSWTVPFASPIRRVFRRRRRPRPKPAASCRRIARRGLIRRSPGPQV